MSLPGFGTSISPEESAVTSSIDIPAFSEWRIEVPFRTYFKFKVIKGVAEIFGTELPLNVEIQFCGVKYAIYAPLSEGCTIEYATTPNKENMTNEVDDVVEYLSEETVMKKYINLHLGLEGLRQQISDHNIINSQKAKNGPRVLILGGKCTGKTALAKILSSYALKMDSTPILVNLNPRDGVFALPGSITATPVSDSFDLECAGGWGFSTTSGTLYHNPKQPIVKNVGFVNFDDNLDLYKYQISKLGLTVMSRVEEDPKIKSSGIIIDTPPLAIKDISLIENIISDFEVNVIVVIGNERLSIDLKKKFKHKLSSAQLDIVKVPRSEGAVEVDESFVRRVQEETIKEYFHGNYKTRLSPFKTELEVRDYSIYKGILSLDLASTLAFLPAGDSYTADGEGDNDKQEENSLDKYYSLLSEPSPSNLDNSILAVTQLAQKNMLTKDLLNTSVLGYVHISKYDDTKGKLRVLLPFPGAFPRNVLISTHIGFSD
ncbi:protein CLP1 [Suhomyces tanzawaensis NRRL Y-17324]|uniref:Polynucleotide 5'-hydroxyl-kinase GRC3 n=1 Tax=Suhomyces tanzawaensis NRRL Y-17324 TaxID=984487 RepID=A0A1E4SPQ0_9ASCO|nr:protein CLP1 [Suhomyces tanzawaensis NRRL Y-17324]ODV81501.1 protein CLP1 [Suhomyces tanzawaensis NRRL Y-17324]